jgi:hypothetical protein
VSLRQTPPVAFCSHVPLVATGPELTATAHRQELVAWLNNLLQLNITKVEQCGTGAALCQIFDSIFYDVPMARVKFNANTEYAYLQNFKILQSTLPLPSTHTPPLWLS